MILPNKSPSLDSSRYVESHVFNDFSKHIKKELQEINSKYLENKTLIDEILELIRIKATYDDLKALEGRVLFNLIDFLISKLEEFKIGNVRKFADKIEVSKNIRYLDTQIKHILDVYIKKMDKGDNWLIAKKPMNGFTCASCEQYLGDLQENNQFVPWNKIPNQNEKIYRVYTILFRLEADFLKCFRCLIQKEKRTMI